MSQTPSILSTILERKRAEIKEREQHQPLAQLMGSCLSLNSPRPSSFRSNGFVRELKARAFPAVIAEIKRASPSRGVIRADLDPVWTAQAYERAGAACLSVLTDEEFFHGQLSFIKAIRESGVQLPVLRKDFIIDRYQVWETKAAGAQALLLIVAALSELELATLLTESHQAELDVLLEVHTDAEITTALSVLAHVGELDGERVILGVNNRDLKTFTVDLAATQSAAERLTREQGRLKGLKLPLVAESGIRTGRDIATLSRMGADGYLVGESLVAEGDPEENLRSLIDDARQAMPVRAV